MKKIVSLILIIFIIFGMSFAVNASENEVENNASIDVSIDGPSSIEVGTKSITLTIRLGAFTGVEENKTLGYDTILKYNKDAISSVTVEGLNGWIATYTDDIQRIIGESDSPKANTQIAKVIFQLKENLTDKTDLGIVFTKFNISDDVLLDQTSDLTKTITIKNIEASTEKKDETEQEPKQILKEDDKVNTKDDDKTKAKVSSLPKAGIKTVLIPCIVIIAILGLVFIVRSKSIKLK